MAYKAAKVWNGSSFDDFGVQAVSTLTDYARLSPSPSQTITNTTLTSPTISSPIITGNTNHSGNLDVTGRLDTYDIRESVADGTITTNILTVDYSISTINFISSAPSANFTVNVTNVPTDNGKAITIVVFVTQGATGYIPNVLQIGGVGQTIRWVAGGSPTPTNSAGKIDVFNFTLIRRSDSWTILGNSSLNF